MQREIEAPKIRYTFYFDDEEPLVFSVTHRERWKALFSVYLEDGPQP